jgi:hypothetical protein
MPKPPKVSEAWANDAAHNAAMIVIELMNFFITVS